MALTRLEKQPFEKEYFEFDYSQRTQLRDGTATISSAGTITEPTGDLTIQTPTVTSDGKKVQALISGGDNGQIYCLTSRITLTTGEMLEHDGELYVREL